MSINFKSIPQLNDVIWRYEPSIDEGTVFIYHIDDRKIYEGNEAVLIVLELINGINNLEQITQSVAEKYNETPSQEFEDAILDIYKFCIDNNIVNLGGNDK